MNSEQIKVWHKCFKDGWESVESDPHSRRPATNRTPENVEHVQAAIHKYQRLTVRELEADVGVPKTTVSEILTQDLGMKHLRMPFQFWHFPCLSESFQRQQTKQKNGEELDISERNNKVWSLCHFPFKYHFYYKNLYSGFEEWFLIRCFCIIKLFWYLAFKIIDSVCFIS